MNILKIKKYYRLTIGKLTLSILLITGLIMICWGNVFAQEKEANKPEPSTQSKKAAKKVFYLEDAIELASKVHPDLKSAIALKNAADARVTQTRSVYYPQVSLSSSYSRGEYGNSTVKATDSFHNSISLSQKIYDFGRTHYAVLSAKENLKAAQYDVLISSDSIILDVRQSYYNAVAALKVLDVTKETIEQQKLHLKQATGFYQVGRRSKIEVTQAKVDLANAQLNLIKAENTVKLTKVQLANAIGLESLPDYPLNDKVNFVELKIEPARALEYAKNNRPDLLKIKANERSYMAQVKQDKAQWYPTLNGSTSYGYNDDHYIFERNSWTWGVSLDFDVFSGGSRNASIKESQENLKSLQENKKRLWQNIILEVQQIILSLEEAKKRISVLETTLDQARENFSLAQGRYEVGVGDNIEFTDARIALQNAKIDLIKAILDYHIAKARLEKAIGISVLKTSLKNNLETNLENSLNKTKK